MKSDHFLTNKYTSTIIIGQSATCDMPGPECIEKLNSNAVFFLYCGLWPIDGLSGEFFFFKGNRLNYIIKCQSAAK